MGFSDEKLNGSVDLLVKAMRDVFSESMQNLREGIKVDVKKGNDDLINEIIRVKESLAKQIDTTNENMQAQFADQRIIISELR